MTAIAKEKIVHEFGRAFEIVTAQLHTERFGKKWDGSIDTLKIVRDKCADGKSMRIIYKMLSPHSVEFRANTDGGEDSDCYGALYFFQLWGGKRVMRFMGEFKRDPMADAGITLKRVGQSPIGSRYRSSHDVRDIAEREYMPLFRDAIIAHMTAPKPGRPSFDVTKGWAVPAAQ